MEVVIQDAIKQRAELHSAIEHATDLLRQELSPASGMSRANWALSKDEKGRDLIDLTVSDWTGSVGYRFAPDELSNETQMRRRLHRLWGDLLQVRSHVQLDEQWWHLQGQEGH